MQGAGPLQCAQHLFLSCRSAKSGEKIGNLLLEHLKEIQAEQSAARECDAQIMLRLAQIEIGIARLARDESNNDAELVQDRHVMDQLRERVERIERRLEPG